MLLGPARLLSVGVKIQEGLMVARKRLAVEGDSQPLSGWQVWGGYWFLDREQVSNSVPH